MRKRRLVALACLLGSLGCFPPATTRPDGGHDAGVGSAPPRCEIHWWPLVEPPTLLVGSGGGGFGDADGPLSVARTVGPMAIVLTFDQRLVFTDFVSVIREIDLDAGVARTLAGSPSRYGHVDGDLASAEFESLLAVASAPEGILATEVDAALFGPNSLGNHVRLIDLDAGIVSTMAGSSGGSKNLQNGPAQEVSLGVIFGIAAMGDAVFLADNGYDAIRVVADGGVATLAGNGTPVDRDGTGTLAGIPSPTGLAAVDGGLIFTEAEGSVRAVDLQGNVTTLTPVNLGGLVDGPLDAGVGLGETYGVAADSQGNLFVVDQRNRALRLITGGQMYTLMGDPPCVDGGVGSLNLLDSLPSGVAVDDEGDVYVSDSGGNRIWKLKWR